MSTPNLAFYGKDFYEYTKFLSSENTYYILISKELLIRPMISIWLYLLGLFSVPNGIFFAMVGLPSLIIFSVFLIMQFSLWKNCNISAGIYIFFHSGCILLIKLISIPVSMFLEALWTSCF